MDELTTHTAVGLAGLVRDGQVSAREVVDAHLERIRLLDGDPDEPAEGDLHAFLEVTAEHARRQADGIDEVRSRGEPLGPLAGVPVAVKDVLTTRGTTTTCGSRMLADWHPPYDATVVSRIAGAGAVMVGKTNMDEFAMGSSTENSAFGPTRNPWDLGRVPGGSSGGSAAAVAAGEAPLALGTDTGGSIRQPASLCGIVGGKPTYGLVSRHGLVAFGSSLDQAGPMARTVEDAALLQEAIQGHDPNDSTSIPEDPPALMDGLRDGVEGLTVGLVTELAGEGFDPEVEACIHDALHTLSELGAEVRELSVPHVVHGLPAYYLIAPSEASSNLARFDGTRYGLRVEGETAEEMNRRTRAEGFGPEVKRRIMIGTHALSSGYYDAYYLQASKVRTLIRRDFEKAFGEVDVLVSPTSPAVAFALGSKVDDPVAMYLSDVASVSANLAGIPALSVPAGLAPAGDDDAGAGDGEAERAGPGLPVGLQVMAPVLRDDLLYRVAWAFEQASGFDPTPRGPASVQADS